MKQLEVRQPPFETTQMGLIRGVADALGVRASDPALYGCSGHGFVLNVHKALCPSGPYCFDRGPIERLLANLGIVVKDLGFFWGAETPEERAEIERTLRAEIDEGRPCGLVNMEFQLIAGYDGEGFITAQPWECNDFPPKRLTYGSWQEFGQEEHVNFYTFHTCDPVTPAHATLDALSFAIEQLRRPVDPDSDYAMGLHGYDTWVAAIPEHGTSHGAWWNGRVWSECRIRAGEWLAEVGVASGLDLACTLGDEYRAIGKLLADVADKETPAETKVAKLQRAKAIEQGALSRLVELRTMLGG